MRGWRVWLPAAAVLAICYIATAAPGVTFWDAGEFIAAGYALGIPHPPGTPLFILLLHVWGRPWPAELYAFGANLFSALASAVAGGILSFLVHGWFEHARHKSWFAWAGAICAGTIFTVWSNATEAEVYAAAFLLAACMLLAGDYIRRGRERAMLLLCYLFGLAAALHVSALVAAPAAILLASQRQGRIDSERLLVLASAAVLAMAIGTWSGPLAVVGVIAMATAFFLSRKGELGGRRHSALVAAMLLVGASPILFMLVRAQFDPGINQGNPATWQALTDVIARRQYDHVPLWPRRAPLWIQLGNWFEFADWQFALSLGPTVIPTVSRTTLTLVFAGLAVYGCAAHRREHEPSWRAMLLLFISGSIGVALYLNLRASPSFGWGVLPEGTLREARERDYFFVLGFWTAALWAGIGSVALAIRRGVAVPIGVALAAAPIALNWAAVNRRALPESSLPLEAARGLLEPLPERAVLFSAGDNDSYPLWYAQQVLGLRRDVTVVTVPLLGAAWYVDELLRRNPELSFAKRAEGVSLLSIRAAALANARPVVASLMLEPRDRAALEGCWSIAGMVLNDAAGRVDCVSGPGDDQLAVDTLAVKAWIARFGRAERAVRPSIDPVHEYFARLLDCPRRSLAAARTAREISLASTCNP